jgi:anaerobic selenocysteine-containing dehydrogenase
MKRGIKLIVIDPRRTETAKKARIHLQPRPGEDATILAGMIRIVLAEGLHDQAFVDENARNLEALREAVESYTPEVVAERADIAPDDLLEATRLFASSSTGGANAGTGPNMAPRGLLTEYLLSCLITLCGFRPRAGDRVPNPGVLVPRGPRRAQAIAPRPAWGYPPMLRFHGLTNTACGLPTAILPDEMLKEGKGQVRALICLGGNPMAAWPDQIKTRKALESLDLLVVLDPKLTQTGMLADFILPPKLVPEIPAFSYDIEELEGMGPGWGYPLPYAAYKEALIDAPEGSDLIEDWQFFYGVAKELGLQLTACAGRMRIEGDPPMRFFPLDMEQMPSTDELFELLTTDARIPLSEVKRYEAGHVFEVEDAVVLPREADCEGFLELGNEVMMSQLADAARDAVKGDSAFPFRLVSRRQADTLNSQGRDQAKLCRERPHNPLHMHPDDMVALDIEPGMLVAITSRRATIHAFAKSEEDLRRGVVSMSHSYGIDVERLDSDSKDGAPQPYSMGGHTGALVSADLDYIEPFSGIPRMSAIPVQIAAAPELVRSPSVPI